MSVIGYRSDFSVLIISVDQLLPLTTWNPHNYHNNNYNFWHHFVVQVSIQELAEHVTQHHKHNKATSISVLPMKCLYISNDFIGKTTTVVSPEPFPYQSRALRHGVLQTLICASVVRPKQCPTSNPVLLPSWTVVCLSFTLLMMLLPGRPIMDRNCICKKKKVKPILRKQCISSLVTARACQSAVNSDGRSHIIMTEGRLHQRHLTLRAT